MARGDIVVRLLGDTRDLERKFAGAAASLGGIGNRMARVGDQMSGVGRSLTAGLTLPLVALGAGAIKSAIDFESSFAGVRKTVEATETQLGQLSQQFRDLAKTIPVNVNELNRIGEAAGALGIKTSDIIAFTEVVAKMGITTNLSSDEAATAFGQLGNVLKLTAGDFSRLGSTIVDLGNKGASTEAEITELMLRLAGTGATVGLAGSEIAGLAAAMANAGINAEAGGTSMSRVLQKINEQVANAGPRLAGFAKVAGMSMDEFSTAFKERPAEAVAAFLEGIRKIQAGGGNVIGTLDKLGITEARQIDTLTRLGNAKQSVAETLGIANEAWKKNNALNAEAQKRFDTTASKLGLMKNRFQDVLITLGGALIPVFEQALPIVEMFAGIAEKVAGVFARLPGPVKTIIVVVAGLLAALGPVLIIFGSIASGISAIIALVTTLAPLLAVIGAAIGAIAVPVLIVIGVIAALIAIGVLLWKHWDKVSAALKAIWGDIKAVATTVFNFLKFLFLNFTPEGLIIQHWSKISGFLKAAWNGIKTAATAIFTFLKNLFLNFTPLGQIIKNWDRILAFFRGLPARVTASLSGLWNGLKEAFKDAINWIIHKWNSLGFKIPGFDPPGPGPKFKGITISTPDIPYLAKGGIVKGPTLAMIGEAGPEAVVPLRDFDLRRDGVVNNYRINVSVPPTANPAEVGREVVHAIQAFEKRSGRGWRS